MSLGDFDYQETTSHFLTRVLKNLRQDTIIRDAYENQVDDVEEFPISRQVQSIQGTKDTLTGATLRMYDDNCTLPSEPSNSTKLWLWCREGWRIKDHSTFGNQAFFEHDTTTPWAVDHYVPLKRKTRDDDLTEGRVYASTNGTSQYIRVKDAPSNRISSILQTASQISFSIFLSPFNEYQWDVNQKTSLFTKIDDDQVTNAIRVEVDVFGAITWRLIYQGSPYKITTGSGVTPIFELSEFMELEFKPEEFNTHNPSNPWQSDVDITPPDWTWLFFTFDKVTRQLSIYKVADGGFTATLIAQSATDETGIRDTFALHIPANEGSTNVETDTHIATALDMVGSNHAVFNPDSAPTKQPHWNPNTSILRFQGDDQSASIPNHSSIDNFANYTIAFKVRLTAYSQDANHDVIIGKNISGVNGAVIVTGGFLFYIPGNGSNNLVVDLVTSGGNRFPSVTNAFVNLNQWYDVILTYDGSQYNLSVGGISGTPINASGDTLASPGPMFLGHTGKSFQGDIAHVIIDKGTVWDTAKKNWFATSLVPGNRMGFPPAKPFKPPELEEPTPIVRPVSKPYELIVPDAGAKTQKVNAVQAATTFISRYNVPGGTPQTTSEVQRYTVADGTTGGGGTVAVEEIYNLAAASSTGDIADSAGEIGYVQRIWGSGSNFIGEKPTYMSFWIDSDGDADGTVYCAIFRNNGSYTKIGAGKAASELGSGWFNIIRSDYTDRPAMVMGDGVGIVWEGSSSGSILIKRGGEGNHDDPGGSWQTALETGGVWGNDEDRFSIAGIVKTGGETIPGTNPYYRMDATNFVVAHYQLNSTLENIPVTRIQWRVRRVGSAASARVVCRIRDSSSGLIYTFPQTINFNDIGTTIQNLEFSDPNNNIQWMDGWRICLEFSVLTGINDTNTYLEVNYNSSSSVGGSAIKAQYYRGAVLTGFADLSPLADWAGHMWTGGGSFTSYKVLDNTTTRVAEKVNQSVSPNISKLFGHKLTKYIGTLKKEGTPEGPITIRIYSNSGAYITQFVTQLDASSLSTSDAQYTFTHTLNHYVMAQGDKIAVHFEGGTSVNKVLVKINRDASVGAAADGIKSVLSVWNGSAWVDDTNLDLAGEIFTGGVPDLVSRSKVAIRNDSEFGRLMQDKITRAIIPLKKFGNPTGQYFIRSVRGSDNSNRDLLGFGNIEDLPSTTWYNKDVVNFNATHYIGVSDKIVIEYEGGDINNCLLVKYQEDDPNTQAQENYDEYDTVYEDWNGVEWRKDFPTRDIAATLYIGGDTYTPDAGLPYEEPPDYYDHDLIIGAGCWIKNEFDSFYGMRIRDFRIFDEIYTLEELNTLYENKYSKRGAKGMLALCGYCSTTDQTEPPT